MFDALLIITCNMPAWMSVMGRVGALSSARALLSTQACRGGSNGIDLPTVQSCTVPVKILYRYCTGTALQQVLYEYV